MKHFTVYASLADDAVALSALRKVFKSFGITEAEDRFFRVTVDGTEFSIHVGSVGGADGEAVVRHLKDMYGYFDAMAVDDAERKQLVLTQISVFNTVVGFDCRDNFPDLAFSLMGAYTDMLGGVAFLENGELRDRKGSVILYPDGRRGEADFRPRAVRNMVETDLCDTEEGRARKRRSEDELAAWGLAGNKFLPQLPPADKIAIRGRQEIATRAATVLTVIQFACDVARGQMDIDESRIITKERLERYRLGKSLTQREYGLLAAASPDPADASDLIWHYEAFWVLAWALGLVDRLNVPVEICDGRQAMDTLFPCGDFAAFYAQISPRALPEILDAADLHVRLAWVERQASLDDAWSVGDFTPEIIVYRDLAFQWLFRLAETEWDDLQYPEVCLFPDDTYEAVDPDKNTVGENRGFCSIHARTPDGKPIGCESLPGVSAGIFEAMLSDDALLIAGFETGADIHIHIWDRDILFYASVKTEAESASIDQRVLEMVQGAGKRLIEECEQKLKELEVLAKPTVNNEFNLEMQEYYDAKGLFEQFLLFANIARDQSLSFPEQCEALAPVFEQMAIKINAATENLPKRLKRSDTAYANSLIVLFQHVGGILARVERESLQLSDAFTKAAYDCQLAIEEAYEEMEEIELEKKILSPREEREIAERVRCAADQNLMVEERILLYRKLWDDARIDPLDRIDYITNALELYTAELETFDEDMEQFEQGFVWENPGPYLREMARQIEWAREKGWDFFQKLIVEEYMRSEAFTSIRGDFGSAPDWREIADDVQIWRYAMNVWLDQGKVHCETHLHFTDAGPFRGVVSFRDGNAVVSHTLEPA